MPHERRNPRGFLWCRYGKIFYRHAALFFSSVRPPHQREGACHVNELYSIEKSAVASFQKPRRFYMKLCRMYMWSKYADGLYIVLRIPKLVQYLVISSPVVMMLALLLDNLYTPAARQAKILYEFANKI